MNDCKNLAEAILILHKKERERSGECPCFICALAKRVLSEKESQMKEIEEPLTLNLVLHILRNPFGWSEEAQRTARLAAADTLEDVEKRLSLLLKQYD